jgi:hypothetical protein
LTQWPVELAPDAPPWKSQATLVGGGGSPSLGLANTPQFPYDDVARGALRDVFLAYGLSGGRLAGLPPGPVLDVSAALVLHCGQVPRSGALAKNPLVRRMAALPTPALRRLAAMARQAYTQDQLTDTRLLYLYTSVAR